MRREFIARPDASKGEIVVKWPDTNIRRWSQLTVEQDELAVFFRDGQVQGTIPPGRHTLESSEIPFLGRLVDAATGGGVFKTELYFVSVREFPDLPFGGSVDNVVDPQTGLAVGLGVFGEYSLKVVEAQSLIVTLVGTRGLIGNDAITDWVRQQLLKVLRTDVVGHIVSQGWPILGIAARTGEIEQEALRDVQAAVAPYGLAVVRLGNVTISLKDEDEATLKSYRRDVTYTRLAGGFQEYAQGEAMLGVGQGAAQGGGALPPAMLGIGLGVAGQVGAGQGQAVASRGAIQVRCGSCNALNPEAARFCSSCGRPLGTAAPPPHGAVVSCPGCGTANVATARFCISCGRRLEEGGGPPGPPPPPPEPPGGAPEPSAGPSEPSGGPAEPPQPPR